MNPDPSLFSSEKYRREHLPTWKDIIFTRREFLERTGMGFGAMSLASIFGLNFGGTVQAATEAGKVLGPLAPKKAPLPAKAKAVIHIFAEGGPSHVDTWDPKPELAKYADKTLPGMDGLAFPSPFKFEKKGKSGVEVSEVFPHLADVIDEMAVIRSLWTDIPAHEVAQRFMHTGSLQIPKPSMGSWVVYGLGTENQNMPGFITIGGKPEWRQASFLPGVYQGCNVNYSMNMKLDEVLLNISNQFTPMDRQRRQLDLVHQLNEMHEKLLQKDVQLEARIQSFELAFKMQTEATDAFDISKEPEEIKAMYGITGGGGGGGGGKKAGANPSDMGAKLLVARRLVERGVRFVQIQHGGWDTHANVEQAIPRQAGGMDQPAAALIKDLKQRGLLDSTLIIWGGEFGRTVVRDRNGNATPGRDHNGRAMVAWMAGGGVKGGMTYGATDEFGGRAAENKVHIHDLHATILALLGFDHKKLTYRYNGRDFRFTDNFGNVVKDVIA
ncbi:protein of unknown function DUF1501 [Chthoniobacter flavus Ellin428]|uniref:Sulfatase n=1 Tax=Chthoniobacter flavus Ellin428 TaxID=497964 RepID=B4CWS3_9BACT|nr:DUF1501 domain-containing protein [Chthoniobacter flavus]EDY21865.1 protein of unknown function DUF1501 [Chthoniobacter flavus Ellin428]TCO95789.1 uncharacterized protein DUF1501 [Chthoniobacter flavus]